MLGLRRLGALKGARKISAGPVREQVAASGYPEPWPSGNLTNDLFIAIYIIHIIA